MPSADPAAGKSEIQVDAISDRASLVSVMVDGDCVWNQTFAASTADAHKEQIDALTAQILGAPDAYDRRVVWSGKERAAQEAAEVAAAEVAAAPTTLGGDHAVR